MQNAVGLLRKYVKYLTRLEHIKFAFYIVLVTLLVTLYFYSSYFTESLYSLAKIAKQNANKTSSNRTYQTRLFCIILATPNSFKSSKAFTVLNAWANKCDNYRFVSKIPVSLVPSAAKNQTNKTVFANGKEVNEPVNLLHPTEMLDDEYSKLTYKMFYTIKDVYLKYSGQYDWFLKGILFVNF
jgi:type III secretory pathway component EscS